LKRALLVLAALGAAVLAALAYFSGPAPTAPPPAPTGGWPAPPAARADRVAPPAATTTSDRLPATLLRATVTDKLRSSPLPPAVREQLVAGDVAGAASALANLRQGAALLDELRTLCRSVTAGDESVEGAARVALGAASRDPAAAATLDALVAARRLGRERLAAGCAGAHLDATAIANALETSARAGDAASLERIARDEGRLASAALLGSARAQLRLGLEHLAQQPLVARSWLEAAAKQDADAAEFLGTCLLDGCGGPPDPAAARSILESAARRGSASALALLASASAEEFTRWVSTSDFITPVPPRNLDALGLSSTERYAWAGLAAGLAEQGCFGFDVNVAARALALRAQLADSLSPSDAAAGNEAARALGDATAGTVRHARGCD